MEANSLYQKKYDAFQKAVNRQEGPYVPTAITNNGGGLFWRKNRLRCSRRS